MTDNTVERLHVPYSSKNIFAEEISNENSELIRNPLEFSSTLSDWARAMRHMVEDGYDPYHYVQSLKDKDVERFYLSTLERPLKKYMYEVGVCLDDLFVNGTRAIDNMFQQDCKSSLVKEN